MSGTDRDLRATLGLVESGLAAALPGAAAHELMSPRPRFGWKPGVIPQRQRQAAGLLLLYPVAGAPHLLLTLRRSNLPDHGGQVSLPGGEMEAGETAFDAALREAHEEVGLDPALVRIHGRLSPLHIPVSQFVLHPVIGSVAERPDLAPSDDEVERIIDAPLATLTSTEHLLLRTSTIRDQPTEIPYFLVGDLHVWGATAMVLAEFLAVIGAAPDPWALRVE